MKVILSMRDKIFFIKINGEVDHVFHPASSQHGFIDGDTDSNGRLIMHMDEHVDVDDYMMNKYWDFGSSQWKDRDSCPGQHYFWNGSSWELDSDKIIEVIRAERHRLLARSDWTQVPDSPLSTDMRNAWAGYRQELRDITNNLEGVESPEDVNWPEPPQ